MNFSYLVKTLRRHLFLTQEELAKELGVSLVSVCRWENGNCEPTMKIKRKIITLCKENGLILK